MQFNPFNLRNPFFWVNIVVIALLLMVKVMGVPDLPPVFLVTAFILGVLNSFAGVAYEMKKQTHDRRRLVEIMQELIQRIYRG